jgi:hypothetical protein
VEHELQLEEQAKFEELIDNSVIERYDSELERLGEGRHGEIGYRPIDTDCVLELLIKLWGNPLTPEAINDAFDRLMQHEEWPHGWCEEEEEEEEEEDEKEHPLSSYRTEADEEKDRAYFEAINITERNEAIIRGKIAAEI